MPRPEELDPQLVCKLLGIDHFPHWLASAANMLLLALALKERGYTCTVREAIQQELFKCPTPAESEKSQWWLAMKADVERLERDLSRHYTAARNAALDADAWIRDANVLLNLHESDAFRMVRDV